MIIILQLTNGPRHRKYFIVIAMLMIFLRPKTIVIISLKVMLSKDCEYKRNQMERFISGNGEHGIFLSCA